MSGFAFQVSSFIFYSSRLKLRLVYKYFNNQHIMNEMHPTMAQRIQKVPQLNSFASEVNKILDGDYPESFWECEKAFLGLVKSDFVTNLFNYELGCLNANDSYAVSDANPGGFFIVNNRKFRLGIALFQSTDEITPNSIANKVLLDNPAETREMLYGITSHQMIGICGNSEIELEWYKQPNPHPIEIFDDTRLLTKTGFIKLAPKSVTCFRAYENAYNFMPPKTPTIMLFFLTKDLGNLRWEYDSETLKPTKIIATNMNSSRLQWTLETLTELDCLDAVENIEKLYKHPDHFVRWSAISSLIQLDYKKGFNLLQKSLNDSHPHVRNVAQKSIQMIKEETL